MLFKKEKIEELGDVNLENLEPLSEFEETGKVSLKKEELPKDQNKIYEMVLHLKKKEELYNKSIIILIIMNLFLTAVVIYLGIVKIT